MQFPLILPSYQNPRTRLPDLRLMHPYPSSLPWKNWPSQVSIYPSSMRRMPLPWISPLNQYPRQIYYYDMQRVPKPCLLPWWKCPSQWILSWQRHTPLPSLRPLTISPLNFSSISCSWHINYSTSAVDLNCWVCSEGSSQLDSYS